MAGVGWGSGRMILRLRERKRGSKRSNRLSRLKSFSELVMPLLLSRDELKPLLDLTKAIELIEDAHKQQAEGQVVPHAPYHVIVEPSKGLRIVSGAVLKQRRVGVRMGPNSGLGGGDKMYAT